MPRWRSSTVLVDCPSLKRVAWRDLGIPTPVSAISMQNPLRFSSYACVAGSLPYSMRRLTTRASINLILVTKLSLSSKLGICDDFGLNGIQMAAALLGSAFG
jgi:hypothetical protein